MQLQNLLSEVNYRQITGNTNIDISGLAYDSRKVKKGDLFFCIRGFKADGHTFAHSAQEAGAVAIVVEGLQPDISITQVVVEDAREAMAKMASAFFDHPTRKLKLVGITGTNGKTTTAFMVESILRCAGYKTGLLGTVEYRIGDEIVPVDRTTPESLDLQALFARMVGAGVQAVAIEVSSHAIDLLRVEGCDFDAVVFTNLSQDHLDYHKTMSEYFEAKKKIFDKTISYSVPQIINIDDEYGLRLVNPNAGRQLRYSIKDEVELYASDLVLRPDGSDFSLSTAVGHTHIALKLPGSYNIYNAMAAAGASMALGVATEKIKEGLEGLDNVPGRFECIDCGQQFSVIVDYAHTPDSLEKVLGAARQLTEGRLITVFGCGGDRDKGKRPIMGEVAAKLSDYVIVTSDNPRSEDPSIIIEEIISGVHGVDGAHYTVQEDRRRAIELAIKAAQSGDFVVVAGKGHEQGQEIAGTKIPFDDVKVAMELLREMMS